MINPPLLPPFRDRFGGLLGVKMALLSFVVIAKLALLELDHVSSILINNEELPFS